MKKYINANIKASEPPKEQDTCPNCNKSLLAVGIDEKVTIIGEGWLYHREYSGSLGSDGVEDAEYDYDDNIRYNCGGCSYELLLEEVGNLLA